MPKPTSKVSTLHLLSFKYLEGHDGDEEDIPELRGNNCAGLYRA